MTGETESQPEESRASSETGEGSEDREQQRLNDATLDPGALIEQSGDIRQAEEVQATFTALVDNAGNETTPITLSVVEISSTLIPLPGPLVGDGSAVTDTSPGSGSEESAEEAAKKAVEDALKAFQEASGGTGQAAGQMVGASVGDSGSTGSGMGGAKVTGGTSGAASQAGAMVGESGSTGSGMGGAKVTGGTGEAAGQTAWNMVGESGNSGSGMGGAKLVDASSEGAGQTTGAEEGDSATVDPPTRISVEPPTRISDEQGGAKPAAGDSVRQAAPAAESGPAAGDSVRQAAPPAESGPVAVDSLRQAAPPAESGPVAGDSIRQAAPPAESGPVAGDSIRQAAPPAESGPVAGDSVRQAAPPVTLPGVRGTASEQATAEGRAEEKAPVEYPKEPPPPPPDMESREVETAAVPEGEGASVMSAIPLGGEETGATPETTEAGPESTDQPDQAPVESETGMGAEAVMDTVAASLDENVEGDVNEEGLAEAEEGWKPPEMYMYSGPDGKIVVVGPDGKPMDSPPMVTSPTGAPPFYAYYPGMKDKNGDPVKFEISEYTGSLTDLYLYHDSTGNPIVVDKNGNPVSSPPSLTSPDGATFYAYYGKAGTGESVELQAYKGSLTDLYLYQDSSGKMIVVDADGNPVASPPSVTSADGATFYAYYGKAGTSEQVQLQAYKGSLTDLYLYQDSSGKTIVVDADGNPVSCPPSVTSADGATFYAYYGKAGTSEQVQLQAYKGSLTDLYLYQDSTGKMIVVDADGNPVVSPPKVTSADGSTFYASYDNSGTGESVHLQAYKGSLTDVYLYQDSSGKMIVVDATGKPLTSQPSITSPDGATFYASYAGGYKTGDMVQLQYYKPPSNKSKGGAPV